LKEGLTQGSYLWGGDIATLSMQSMLELGGLEHTPKILIIDAKGMLPCRKFKKNRC